MPIFSRRVLPHGCRCFGRRFNPSSIDPLNEHAGRNAVNLKSPAIIDSIHLVYEFCLEYGAGIAALLAGSGKYFQPA